MLISYLAPAATAIHVLSLLAEDLRLVLAHYVQRFVVLW